MNELLLITSSILTSTLIDMHVCMSANPLILTIQYKKFQYETLIVEI